MGILTSFNIKFDIGLFISSGLWFVSKLNLINRRTSDSDSSFSVLKLVLLEVLKINALYLKILLGLR